MFDSITILKAVILVALLSVGWNVYNTYKGLQSTVETQRNKITGLESDLKLTREISAANLKKIKELEATIEVNSKAVSTLCTLNNEVTTRTNEVIVTRRKREKVISQSYTDTSKKIVIKGDAFFKKFDITLNEDNQLSEARINSIWESYCSNKKCEGNHEDEYQDDGITK
jgi:uncharacterized protein YoxC